MSKVKSQAGATQLSYLESLAGSLIQYARANKDFAQKLKALVANLPHPDTRVKPDYAGSLISPLTEVDAAKRANWLIAHLQQKTGPQVKRTIARLKQFQTEPRAQTEKHIVIGIVGMAIIGPTLGIVSRKKSLMIIVDDKFTQNQSLELARKATQASIELVTQALKQVNNDLKNIEPEIGQWFFNDRLLSYYQAQAQSMPKIKTELESYGINYGAVKDDEKELLAISPAVNPAIAQASWDLKNLEQ